MINLICIVATILTLAAFTAGFVCGEKQLETKVIKNCLASNIHPKVCSQYMRMVKNEEYRQTNGR